MAGGQRPIESRQIAEHVGRQAESGENIMREVSTLMNTQKGPMLKDEVFKDMVKLQNEGKLPGIVLNDSRGRPITNPDDSAAITTIKSKGSDKPVYKLGDFYLETADRQDTLKDMPGFSSQYKDMRRNPFDVAKEQAQQQRRADQNRPPVETASTDERAQKQKFDNCMDIGQSDIKMSHRIIECSAETGYKPPGVKMNNVIERDRKN